MDRTILPLTRIHPDPLGLSPLTCTRTLSGFLHRVLSPTPENLAAGGKSRNPSQALLGGHRARARVPLGGHRGRSTRLSAPPRAGGRERRPRPCAPSSRQAQARTLERAGTGAARRLSAHACRGQPWGSP
jgi:hypothetical protein